MPLCLSQADELQRQVLEAKARLVDSEHVAKQLHKVMGERDALQEQVNALRNAHSQGETGQAHLAGRTFAAASPAAATVILGGPLVACAPPWNGLCEGA